MLKYLIKPEGLFALTGLLFILLSLLFPGVAYDPSPGAADTTLDIQVHDTYFVIEHSHVLIAFGMMFFFFSAIYLLLRLLRREMYKVPGYIHWLLTIALPLLIIIPVCMSRLQPVSNERYYNEAASWYLSYPFVTLIILFLAAQVIFLVNIFFSAIRKKP